MSNPISAFLNTEDRLLLVVGKSMSGKTSTCIDALKSGGYEYFIPAYVDYANHKQLQEAIDNFLNSNDILSFFESPDATKPKKALFFDDIEIAFANDRFINTLIRDLVEKSKSVSKIIVSCVSSEEKKLSELKKITGVKYIKMQMQMQRQRSSHGEAVDSYIDMNIYDLTDALFKDDSLTLVDLDIAVSSEPLLISCMMYDNAHLFIKNEALQPMYDIFCEMSLFEDFAYRTGDWSLLDLSALVQCGFIKHLLSLQQCKKNKEVVVDTFTQIPSRSSQRYCVIRKKNAILHEKGLEFMDLVGICEDMVAKQPKTARGRSRAIKFNLKSSDYDQVLHSITSNLLL